MPEVSIQLYQIGSGEFSGITVPEAYSVPSTGKVVIAFTKLTLACGNALRHKVASKTPTRARTDSLKVVLIKSVSYILWEAHDLGVFAEILVKAETINRQIALYGWMCLMNKLLLTSLALASGMLLVVYASYSLYEYYEYNRPRTFYDNGVTDQEYIAITDRTLEAMKFREKYPNATIQVDRSGALAVDYRVDTNNQMEYLRLRVFIDWRTNKPSNMFIDNSGTYITENLLEYIEAVEFPS